MAATGQQSANTLTSRQILNKRESLKKAVNKAESLRLNEILEGISSPADREGVVTMETNGKSLLQVCTDEFMRTREKWRRAYYELNNSRATGQIRKKLQAEEEELRTRKDTLACMTMVLANAANGKPPSSICICTDSKDCICHMSKES